MTSKRPLELNTAQGCYCKSYCACSLGLTSDLLYTSNPGCQTMAGAGLDPSSQALLNKLDECLVGCIPKKVENAHGVDYTIGLDELKKVYQSWMHMMHYRLESACNDAYLLSKTACIVNPIKFVTTLGQKPRLRLLMFPFFLYGTLKAGRVLLKT